MIALARRCAAAAPGALSWSLMTGTWIIGTLLVATGFATRGGPVVMTICMVSGGIVAGAALRIAYSRGREATAAETLRAIERFRALTITTEVAHLRAGGTIDDQAARIAELERLDREASTYVETVICTRTGFDGDPPYVGWQGLGLALTEALDERDRLRAEVERKDEALRTAEQFISNGIEFGAIRMPDESTPDPAHETLPAIRAALKTEGWK